MPFPHSPRVIFEKNPLREVVCQVRYPTILRVEHEDPAEFQERIRREYPLYEESRPAPLFDGDLSPAIAKLVKEQFALPGSPRNFNFRSEDQIWCVGLTKDFLSLSTHMYETWQQFEQHLHGPFRALVDLYSPTFFVRVGLRYQDLISRARLGLEKRPWSDLIKAPFAGELADAVLGESVDQAMRTVRIVLPDKLGSVQIRHGLVTDGNEVYFLLDFDFFTVAKTEVEDALERLNHFNRLSGSLFRHCITPELYGAMGPRPI